VLGEVWKTPTCRGESHSPLHTLQVDGKMNLPRLGKTMLGAECLTKNWLELHRTVSLSAVKITLSFLTLPKYKKMKRRRETDKRRKSGQLKKCSCFSSEKL